MIALEKLEEQHTTGGNNEDSNKNTEFGSSVRANEVCSVQNAALSRNTWALSSDITSHHNDTVLLYLSMISAGKEAWFGRTNYRLISVVVL